MDSERIYLDYNATSPLSQSVLNWLKSGDLLFGNPSSQHSSGKASRKAINEARALIYKTFLQTESETKLFFHSGATEAMMTFAYSFAEWARKNQREVLICYSKLDHPAVTSLSEKHFGSHVSFLELKRGSDLEYKYKSNLEEIKELKKKNPSLVILCHHLWVHNETGMVSALENLKEYKTLPDLYLHVDAVQAPGKILDWKDLKVGDIFTFSAHKFGAFKGIGFSFFPKSLPFNPLISGGGQQSNLRSGTENVTGIQSVALALTDLLSVDVLATSKLREELENFVSTELQGVGAVVNLQGKVRNSNTIYFYLKDVSSDIALALFDLSGVMISAGSACSSGAAKPSPILEHLGFTKEVKNGLRISFSYQMTHAELDRVKLKLGEVFKKLKA